MALCLFSRLNRDEYTRRVFEIPACGALLLCERTPTMESLYRDGKEAVYFSSPEELVSKAKWLLAAPDEARAIAEAGRQRCLGSGYDVRSRMSEMLAWLREHAPGREA